MDNNPIKSNDNLITITDDQGNEVKYSILFTFHSNKFNKDYVLFYPEGAYDDDNDDELEINAASYNDTELFEIESDDEWALIEETLNAYQKEGFGDDEEDSVEEVK